MDFLFSFSTSIAFLLFLLSLLLVSRNLLRNSKNKRSAIPPEADGAWPVLGHLHLLGGPQPAHIILGNMADKHGPIFTVRLGVHRALVVSSWEMAKESLTTNDKSFANRPKTLATEILCYDLAMFGFSHYGLFWRQARKLATLELLSNHRLQTLKHVWESEMKESSKELYQFWLKNKNSSNKVLTEMKKWFSDVNLNVILRIVVGKRFTTSCEGEENKGWRKALKDFFELGGRFVLSDAFPFLRWLDIGGHERFMRSTMKELDTVAERWLQEHKHKRLSSGEVKVEEDFMDVMLSIIDNSNEFCNRDADTFIKATSLGLVLAASDTTSVTLAWCLSLLLNNHAALRKAQDELDIHVGRERQVNESDMKNLVYLQAIIKETLRLYPAAPLLLPHESMEDCTVGGGYHIPKGTRLIINASKIQRDPNVWPDPCEFQPERFLRTHKDVDVRGQNFELIPFGSGRRMCPGVSFALQVLKLTLANLLHGFEMATPSNEPVDMSDGLGLTNLKATPLQVLLAPRLPTYLY